MRILIAGGGTGGHVIPALAIARELKTRYGAEVLFWVTERRSERRRMPQARFGLMRVKVRARKNVSAMTRLRTLFDLPRAVVDARKIIKVFNPDVVVGVGGYASGPAMAAAILMHIPTLAFEPNFVPGFANKIVGHRVSAAAVHFEQTQKFFRNAQVVGVPVRAEFFKVATTNSNDRAPVLLVFGGSQGAQAINQAMVAAAPEVLRQIPRLRITHQTGERDYNDVQAAYEHAGVRAEVSAFIDDMPAAFARADLLLCRSGASTVAEIAAAGKAAIFVPFPRAADDHQRVNAQALERAGAAVVLEETKLDEVWLVEPVSTLLSDHRRLARMTEAARNLGQ